MMVLQDQWGDFTLVNAEQTLTCFKPRVEGLNTKLMEWLTSASISLLNPNSLLKNFGPSRDSILKAPLVTNWSTSNGQCVKTILIPRLIGVKRA